MTGQIFRFQMYFCNNSDSDFTLTYDGQILLSLLKVLNFIEATVIPQFSLLYASSQMYSEFMEMQKHRQTILYMSQNYCSLSSLFLLHTEMLLWTHP